MIGGKRDGASHQAKTQNDRFTEITERWEPEYGYIEDEDVEWLISEVKRLREVQEVTAR